MIIGSKLKFIIFWSKSWSGFYFLKTASKYNSFSFSNTLSFSEFDSWRLSLLVGMLFNFSNSSDDLSICSRLRILSQLMREFFGFFTFLTLFTFNLYFGKGLCWTILFRTSLIYSMLYLWVRSSLITPVSSSLCIELTKSDFSRLNLELICEIMCLSWFNSSCLLLET